MARIPIMKTSKEKARFFIDEWNAYEENQRREIAKAAMQGLVACSARAENDGVEIFGADSYAKCAYKIADAMIKEGAR